MCVCVCVCGVCVVCVYVSVYGTVVAQLQKKNLKTSFVKIIAMHSTNTHTHTQNLFVTFTVTAATELTLGANAPLDSVHRLQWKTTDDKGNYHSSNSR